MESLNMSNLNLSGLKADNSGETVSQSEVASCSGKFNAMNGFDDEYHGEYREEIWDCLLEQELEMPPIHLQSPQLMYRGSLVQQLRDVSKSLGLSIATLHAAVAHLDQFMDAHELRTDRLKHVALACLSLAAKSDEKFSQAPTLKTLAKVGKVDFCVQTFRQLEWMIGQFIKWRLLAPTPATYAGLLEQFVVTEQDLTSRHPKFVWRYKRDGARLLDEFLDLSLSQAKLSAMSGAEVGCACVWGARQTLGAAPWPAHLAVRTRLSAARLQPTAALLCRMMEIMKSRPATTEPEVDQGYGSDRTTPAQTPNASPRLNESPDSNSSSSHTESYRNRVIVNNTNSYSVSDLIDSNPAPSNMNHYLPRTDPYRSERDSLRTFRLTRSLKLIEGCLDPSRPSTSVASKRCFFTNNYDFDVKRMRLMEQISKTTL